MLGIGVVLLIQWYYTPVEIPHYTTPPQYHNLMEKIRFVTPASGISKKQKIVLEDNYRIHALDSEESSVPYCAGEDDKRFNELKNAFEGDKKYIWSLRGGYGSLRLFNELSIMKKPEYEKIVIGYSDITFLHLFLHQKWGWHTIHAAMPLEMINSQKNPKNFSLLFDILEKRKGVIEYDNIIPLNKLARDTTSITSSLTGGNLTIINTSMGTPWQIDAKNKILFIEDNNNKGYILDRDLTHLRQSGVLSHVNALIIGTISGTEEQHIKYAINDFLQHVNIPVYAAHFIGHGVDNYPLPLGYPTKISKIPGENNYTLSIKYDFEE